MSGAVLTPSPSVKRPSESVSRVEAAIARVAALRLQMPSTALPSRIRCVLSASSASATATSQDQVSGRYTIS
ncbi:MAG TPA: hypothetical protein VMR50_13035 [Myxococcota bacterium]|nr:hypothetical protein [Myxococcota bacterium]